MFVKNMEVCEEFAGLSHLDCQHCFGTKVELTGKYMIEGNGFYVEVQCKDEYCERISECGDGEFLTEVATFDGEKFHPIQVVVRFTDQEIIDILKENDINFPSKTTIQRVKVMLEKQVSNVFENQMIAEAEIICKNMIENGEVLEVEEV
ncbi:hypothetical protein [Bacillus cereus]|uniref:hypothetical protein n=1 Tax=Bacillus cereus TaxID=1396 RepID=UPI000B4ABAE4|nr:hypothetical protein [Bacillus cereus]